MIWASANFVNVGYSGHSETFDLFEDWRRQAIFTCTTSPLLDEKSDSRNREAARRLYADTHVLNKPGLGVKSPLD